MREDIAVGWGYARAQVNSDNHGGAEERREALWSLAFIHPQNPVTQSVKIEHKIEIRYPYLALHFGIDGSAEGEGRN